MATSNVFAPNAFAVNHATSSQPTRYEIASLPPLTTEAAQATAILALTRQIFTDPADPHLTAALHMIWREALALPKIPPLTTVRRILEDCLISPALCRFWVGPTADETRWHPWHTLALWLDAHPPYLEFPQYTGKPLSACTPAVWDRTLWGDTLTQWVLPLWQNVLDPAHIVLEVIE